MPVTTKSTPPTTATTDNTPLLTLLEKSLSASGKSLDLASLLPKLDKASSTTYSDIQKALTTGDFTSVIKNLEQDLNPSKIDLTSTFPNLAKIEKEMQGGLKSDSSLFPNLDKVSSTTYSDIQKSLNKGNLTAAFEKLEQALNPGKLDLTATFPNLAKFEKEVLGGPKINASLVPALNKALQASITPNTGDHPYIQKAVAEESKITASIEKPFRAGTPSASNSSIVTHPTQNSSRSYLTGMNAVNHTMLVNGSRPLMTGPNSTSHHNNSLSSAGSSGPMVMTQSGWFMVRWGFA